METESTEPPIETVNEVPEAGSRSEPMVGSYASVTAQPATVRRETVCDEEPQLYDGHFHLDRMLGKDARVSEMLRMPLSRRSGTTGRLRGGVVVFFFCDPHSDPRNVDRIVDVPGFIPAVGIHPKQVSTWTASEMESFKILIRSTKVKALGEVGLDFQARHMEKARGGTPLHPPSLRTSSQTGDPSSSRTQRERRRGLLQGAEIGKGMPGQDPADPVAPLQRGIRCICPMA
ncbi:hydrolase TatD [Elysia marginata]|uniref:Hydrolase TatD n=1 Tax=Elysia marginata TaxID=1093978 RepID=A0AAV4ECI7_9GAST|nr:hydrolase TatD [Elysia marginata]